MFTGEPRRSSSSRTCGFRSQ